MIEIMLDLEFMGKPPHAAISAIGAAMIIDNVVTSSFYQRVDLRDSVRMGGTLDADTIIWWLGQPDAARAEMCLPGESLGAALSLFTRWVKGQSRGFNVSAVWGYGATADLAIIRHAYDCALIPTPWDFRADSCFRTETTQYVRRTGKQVPWVEYGTSHHAGDDAKAQALTLIEMRKAD